MHIYSYAGSSSAMTLSNDTISTNYTWTIKDFIKLGEFMNQRSLAIKILYVFITIPITLGNTLVLLTTWKERRLHQPNKYFIACLAVADLFTGMFIGPVSVYYSSVDYTSGGDMSVHLCRFFVWMDILLLTASIYTLAFISFDRYLKLCKPLQYKSRMTTSKSLKIIFIIWSISVSFATYAATADSGSRGILLGLDYCLLVNVKQARRFYTSLFPCIFFIPAIFIMIMYSCIFAAAHKRHKMLRSGQLGETCSSLQRQRNVLSQDLKTVRMLLVVVGIFILCWFPTVISFIVFFDKISDFSLHKSLRLMKLLGKLSVVMQLLPLLNSLCNPLVYACMDQTYREAFKRQFQRMTCRKGPIRQQQQQRQQLQQQQHTASTT